MKLYATVTSEKGGRLARKGGNEWIYTTLFNGNIEKYYISMNDTGISVHDIENDKQLVYTIK